MRAEDYTFNVRLNDLEKKVAWLIDAVERLAEDSLFVLPPKEDAREEES